MPSDSQTKKVRPLVQKHKLMTRRDGTIACVILAGAIVLRAALLGAPVHDYDEGVYWQSLLAMHDGYAQYRDLFVSQPPLFLDLTYLFFAALGKSIVAARAAGLFGSLLTIVCGSWIAYRASGRIGALVALAFLAFNNIDLAESVTLQAEAVAAGLATLSVALVVERSSRARNAIALTATAGAVAAGAILVKFLAIACVIPFLVFVLWKRDLRGFIGYGIGALALALVVLAPHFAALHQMLAQTVMFHLASEVSVPRSRLSTIATGVQAPLVLLCLIGVVMAIRRKDVCALSIAAWLAAVFVMFFRITPLFSHHLDAIQAPLLVLAAYGVTEMVKAARMPATVGIVVAALLVEAWYATGQIHRILHPLNPRLVSTRVLTGIVPAGQWVITDLQATAAAAGYRTPPDLVDTSMVRVRSGNLTSDQLIRDARDPRVGAIVFGGRRLSLPQLQRFTRWTHVHFHRTASPFVWIR